MKHPVEHLWFPEAAVEPVTEFPQIAGQMFGTDAVVDAPNIAFDIGDQGVDPGQDLRRLLPRTGNQPLMLERRSVQEAVALPAVSLDHHLGGQALPDQGLNLGAAGPGHQAHSGEPGLIGWRFHGYHHLGLAGRSPATFAGFRSPEVGVVHLEQTSQLVVGVPFSHSLANLVAHGPHGFIGFNFQHPLQGQHGNAAFLASHQPDHPEPFVQRGSGLVKHGAGGQRGLITADPAMIEVAGALEISLIMLAAGALKALGPAQAKQMLLTGAPFNIFLSNYKLKLLRK